MNSGKYFGLLNSTLNGESFVQQDNGKSLPVVLLINLTLGREMVMKTFSSRFQIEIRNLLNAHYQVVQYYPEPGVSVMLNVTLIIHKNKKK
jgi:outer membrane cobalamin receptor